MLGPRIISRVLRRRRYPTCEQSLAAPTRPISFVLIGAGERLGSRTDRSDCLRNPLNQCTVVDPDTATVLHHGLVDAIAGAVSRSRHDLIAIVHERITLPSGWHAVLERSLAALEAVDDSWALLGSVGWADDGTVHGHWSDEHTYVNTFGATPYHEVDRVGEQIAIMHRERMLDIDELLPDAHHLAEDLSLAARRRAMRVYAVDAPTIQDDARHRRVRAAVQAAKRADPPPLGATAAAHCSADYLRHKWTAPDAATFDAGAIYSATPGELASGAAIASGVDLDAPIVLVARGGSGSRLQATLARELGVFVGTDLNVSVDALEMVPAIYQALIEHRYCRAPSHRRLTVPRLRSAAARMLERAPQHTDIWGFKVPETIFVIDQVADAFPRARFIHLIRDPLTTCLRRLHMTAMLDNPIGRITLPLAYDHAGLDRAAILEHHPAVHMAYTTIHQLDLAACSLGPLPTTRHLELRFEELIADPQRCADRVAEWIGVPAVRTALDSYIDEERTERPKVRYSAEIEHQVRSTTADARTRYGYANRGN